MRLLNTKSLDFTFFFDEQCPPYYVLSHTWTGQETTWQEFTSKNWIDVELSNVTDGIKKILEFVNYAKVEQCEWVWVDTCCINKESSAELSEAINSMYKWYRDSVKCIVYLADITVDESGNAVGTKLENCRWFTRGWALQELIAPKKCVFVDRAWTPFGSKHNMAFQLSSITNIGKHILTAPDPQKEVLSESIAERMKWASGRVTTRMEDIAYCLLGIFNVNLSLLYGEGSYAFVRLQRKLAKDSSDESLFSWPRPTSTAYADWGGMFAPHPSVFAGVDYVSPIEDWCPPIGLSNRGVEFLVYSRHLDEVAEGTGLIMPLSCLNSNGKRVGVPILRRLNRWCRDNRHDLVDVGSVAEAESLFPKKNGSYTSLYLMAAGKVGPIRKQEHTVEMFQQTLIRFANQRVSLRSLLYTVDFDQLLQTSRSLERRHQEIQIIQCQVAQIIRWIGIGRIYKQNRSVENFRNEINIDLHVIALDMFFRSGADSSNVQYAASANVLETGILDEQKQQNRWVCNTVSPSDRDQSFYEKYDRRNRKT